MHKKYSNIGWVAGITLLFLATLAPAQNTRIIQLINSQGSNALTTLNLGSNFITSFKGTNDVTISPLNGVINGLNSIYTEPLAGSGAVYNPSYLTNFVGNETNKTGTGTGGSIYTLETKLTSSFFEQFQFDFALPLTPLDHVLIFDVDYSEQYRIDAYILHNGVYQQVSVTNWVHQNYAGQTGIAPDSTWPLWNPVTGVLTANTSANLTEPLVVLTPDQPINRVIFTKLGTSVTGSAAIQFAAEAGSVATLQLQIQRSGTNAVVYWPSAFSNFKLYQTDTLGAGLSWSLNTNPVVQSGYWLYVTNGLFRKAV